LRSRVLEIFSRHSRFSYSTRRGGLRPRLHLRFAERRGSVAPMLWAVFHRLVVALTLLAFVGGMTLQVLPPKAAFAAGTMAVPGDCSHVAMPPADPGPAHKVPCKGMDPECIKQMGCLGTPSLPLRLGAWYRVVAPVTALEVVVSIQGTRVAVPRPYVELRATPPGSRTGTTCRPRY